MKAALVIMAAGLGSRYGGNKQVDGVGPNGEIPMEYSIFDAIRAGFTKIVFIIKPGVSAVTMWLAARHGTDRRSRCATQCRIFPVYRISIRCRLSGRNRLVRVMPCCVPVPM